jgi:hypothetical protein
LPVFLRGGLTVSSPRTPFNSFRAVAHLKLVSHHPREIGSPHNRAIFNYIVQNLIDSELQVYRQSWRSAFLTKAWIHQRGRAMRNIVAFRNGSAPTLDWLVLSTHFDSHTNNAGADVSQ